jgi:hypothetical protein
VLAKIEKSNKIRRIYFAKIFITILVEFQLTNFLTILAQTKTCLSFVFSKLEILTNQK